MNTVAITGLGVTAAALLAGGGLYAGMWPTSQIYGRTRIGGVDPAEIALTYDDGPSPAHTPALLDLLAEHHAHATFFLMGEHVRLYPEIARRVAAEGHTIGNHTQTHPNLLWCSAATAHRELSTCQKTIEDVTGVSPKIFRPPFGGRNPATLRIARALGLEPILWNVTAKDWEPIGTAGILSNIDAAMEKNRKRDRGSYVLLHDASHLDTPEKLLSRRDTLAATAELLSRPGLRFVSL